MKYDNGIECLENKNVLESFFAAYNGNGGNIEEKWEFYHYCFLLQKEKKNTPDLAYVFILCIVVFL